MHFHRTRSWLVVFAVAFGAAASARAQVPEPDHAQIFQPFGPVDGGDLADMQPFAPIESGSQDYFPKGAVGPFFRYERLYWSIHQPSFGLIGSTDPTLVALGLSDNTNQFISPNFVWGNRFDIGYRQDDGSGWMTSIVKSNTQFNSAGVGNSTSVGFLDTTGVLPANAILALIGTDTTGVPFPPNPAFDFIQYQPLTIVNNSRFVGVELDKSIRFEPEHHGGVWEFFLGPRFFQFHDRFDVSGTTNPEFGTFPDGTIILPQNPPNIVSIARVLSVPSAPNFWDLGIDNNIVGPQIGTRWTLEREHWTFSADFRALLGFNFQNEYMSGATSAGYTTHIIRLDNGATIPGTTVQVGVLNSALFTFNSAGHNVTFSPLGEARFDAIYKVSKNVSLEVGYTGLLVSGISRASDRIVYTVPNMSIAQGADKQHVYINGVNVGFNVNY
jgi:hypothetical protein